MELSLFDAISSEKIYGSNLDNGSNSIGRSSECSIIIPGRFGSISGVHANLRCSDDSVEIMDGSGQKPSANGTFVNGKRLAQETWSKIKKGDNVSLGIPGSPGSLSLVLSQEVTANRNQNSSAQSEPRASVSNRYTPPPRTVNHQVAVDSSMNNSGRPTSKDTVSTKMRSRLDKIDTHLANGYQLKKSQYSPIFTSEDGREHSINIFSNNPAGFSWMGFFFAFAVCTQIREWSYFYVLGIANFTFSVLSIVFKRDITIAVDLGISIMYGIYFPYLRHMALSKAVPEIGKGRSIIQGIALSILVVIPGLLLTSFLLPT
ncbi:FHA domain-containing protein [Cyanobium sp. A2C-AMD]|uniref:FHA domain-containing protein n=1 Tax=Cyanobium sp. A2C-AMD TaxID=2823695 RepID=UPI0020CCF12A|nr:FHA domain-containing protein [Cyanobium sp. A2C-AMD]MCP9877911.1 FHA domain-containing protein [Cyanobium sp. A2C-AMD]